MEGRRVTSTPGIRDDNLTHAGAEWVDEPVVCDGHWISFRRSPGSTFRGLRFELRP